MSTMIYEEHSQTIVNFVGSLKSTDTPSVVVYMLAPDGTSSSPLRASRLKHPENQFGPLPAFLSAWFSDVVECADEHGR